MEHFVADFEVADLDYNTDQRQVFTDPNITTVFVMAGINVLVIHDSALLQKLKKKGLMHCSTGDSLSTAQACTSGKQNPQKIMVDTT